MLMLKLRIWCLKRVRRINRLRIIEACNARDFELADQLVWRNHEIFSRIQELQNELLRKEALEGAR